MTFVTCWCVSFKTEIKSLLLLSLSFWEAFKLIVDIVGFVLDNGGANAFTLLTAISAKAARLEITLIIEAV